MHPPGYAPAVGIMYTACGTVLEGSWPCCCYDMHGTSCVQWRLGRQLSIARMQSLSSSQARCVLAECSISKLSKPCYQHRYSTSFPVMWVIM